MPSTPPSTPQRPHGWLIPFLLVLAALTVIVVVLLAYGLGAAAAVAAAIALAGAATRVVHHLASRAPVR